MNHASILLLLVSGSASITSARAATTAAFDGGLDTPLTLQTFGDPGGPSLQSSGGNPGGFLRLTDAINGQHNFATFDRSDAGPSALSTFDFQFRIAVGATPSADGFSFSYANTANYGASGAITAAPFTAEDPSAAGILGFGFDTWSNHGVAPGGVDPASPDDPTKPQGSDYQEISLFYNGSLIQRVNDTRLLPVPLTLDDGNWHNVSGSVNFAGGTATLLIDGNVILDSITIPGLTPFESRIMLAARTGGENELAGIDNLNVRFVQTNVFAPGDPIVLVNGTNDGDGDAGPPPGNEGVEHAIDRVVQKYLNFLDLGSGFATTPSMGLTVAEYIRIYTANDAEERDPASFVLEGSRNGLNGPWTAIASGPLSLPSGRNNVPGTTPINPATQFNQLVGFANTTPYSSYRVTFPTLKNAGTANSMQIGEVELLGSAFVCPVPTIAISAPGPNVQACQEVQICATVNSLCVTQVCFLAGATPLGCATASPWCITLPGPVVAPGVYPVTAVAFDSLGRQTPSAPFIVTVADTAPPTVTCPADIAVRATSPAGATVTYVASATDTCGIRTFACVPPSGSVFPVGTTTVTCTAVDTSGNTATCSFNVAVQNQAPVCVAGLFPESCGLSFGDGNTYAIALDNATACVVLNGSGSSDADNDPLQYFWAVDDQFTLSMDANQEPGGSGGSGTGTGTVTLSGNTLTIDVTFSGLSANGSAAHIHGPATRGVNAAVLYSLASLTTLGTTAGTISGTVTLVAGTGGFTIEQQLQQLRAGLWYINIHTPLHAGGEIRGQIDPGVPSGPMVRTCLALGCHSVVLGVSDGVSLSQCSLDVCVITACEAVEQVITLVENATIARKNKRPLIASLKAACASFDRGDFIPGINQLGAFQNKVRAQVAPANPDEARAFITSVQRILTAIDCAVQQGNGVDGPGDQ